MPADSLTLPRWDGRCLALPAAWGPRVSLDIDGHWFSDVEAIEEAALRLELPFSPTGCRAFSPCVRAQRDGDVLWPRESGTATCRFAALDDGARHVVIDAEPMRAEVVIVVPVYNAAEAVRACLDSVLAHTTGRARLMIIDDASPDPSIAPLLARYAGLAGVVVQANPSNLGFTATANRGIAEAGDADVVLLNADTVVGPNWLTGLRRAVHCGDHIATATAVSDHAGAFSVPELEQANPIPACWSVDDMARALWQYAGQAYPELPTGNGFCLYIRRAVIDAVGTLDAEAFPQGYGEENDFCQRASAQGWRHVIAGNVFVQHKRSQSFGTERREALGRAGMAVLRTRWPDYEHDVGAALFSFARRALDWRVRRCHAWAESGLQPQARALKLASPITASASFEVWGARWHEGALAVSRPQGSGMLRLETVAADPDALAHWLERAAIELVDTGADRSPMSTMLRAQAERLGIAVTDTPALASANVDRYIAACAALRSFPGSPA